MEDEEMFLEQGYPGLFPSSHSFSTRCLFLQVVVRQVALTGKVMLILQ